jgi:hypothetical protein
LHRGPPQAIYRGAMTDPVPKTSQVPDTLPRPVRRLLGLVLLAAGLAIPGCVALFSVP